MYRIPQVSYSPLHWLAYWNDYATIEFLLSHVDKDDPEQVEMIMANTSEGLTPLDIAGRHGSNEAALIFMLYFSLNFDIIVDVFKTDKSKVG